MVWVHRMPAIGHSARILAALAVFPDKHPCTIPDLVVSVLCGKWMPRLLGIAQVGTALIPWDPGCQLKAAGFDLTTDDMLAEVLSHSDIKLSATGGGG